MIAGISRRHAKVKGTTPEGMAYRALDPELLRWVQVTASYGFIESYHRFVQPLSPAERDRAYAEALPGARLYGARDSPDDEAGVRALFESMAPNLCSHPIVFEFLDIMRRTEVLPGPLRRLQPMLIRAAVSLVDPSVRRTLQLDEKFAMSRGQARILSAAGRMLDRVVVPSAPPALACQRLGLPIDYLYA
jgi:uncharacterized protein (DUF2236 family)